MLIEQRVQQRAHFRLILMPCCGQLLCWVNPRLPNYCPECGTYVFINIKAAILHTDDQAWITHTRQP